MTDTRLPAQTLDEWEQQAGNLWVFGSASLIWLPDMPYIEQRAARVSG